MEDQTLNSILFELQALNKSQDRMYTLLESTLTHSRASVSPKTHAITVLTFAAMMVLSQIQLYDLKKIAVTNKTIEVQRENRQNEGSK